MMNCFQRAREAFPYTLFESRIASAFFSLRDPDRTRLAIWDTTGMGLVVGGDPISIWDRVIGWTVWG
jgi:hypothetical protein